MSAQVFFQPSEGWVGDVIPFEHDGELFLFYLHELRNDPKPGTAWSLVTTRDLVAFEDRGVAIAAGGEDDSDFNAYTGSVVIDDDGVARLFYTGHNPRHMGPDGETPLQLVMQAKSDDGLRTWRKLPHLTFGAPEGYEAGDWRDPFVFRVDRKGPWRMVLAARHEDGPHRRRGVLAQLTSTDLERWTPVEPFWDPRRYVTHECPDIFQWGEYWYLVYSEFSETFTTRYRISDSADGPWRVPADDTVDGRAFYASKSVERDGRRFFAGWIASKEGSRDDGPYQWAGTMSMLEATQRPDGSLAFHLPSEIIASFDESVSLTFRDASTGEAVELPSAFNVPDGYAAVVSTEPVPSQGRVSVRVVIEESTTECGVLLRSSGDGDESYILRLEPRRGRVVLDRWPREITGPMQWQMSGDVPFAIELERACQLEPGEHTIDIIIDDSLLIAVVDNNVTLSGRIYDRATGHLGVFVGEGAATFLDVQVSTRTVATHIPETSSLTITTR
ncbi:GH32 C-terminal domain-containing protein [uncultured Microbacterium sp.]|uniref:GH32 C-terminal domain-containing protein n=1 Tax=uncultured Microbacterium sp. TaxID=191216 RepID=UPI00260F1183|nr:GH32 C-terminal domain-containing protein [uncultured Microbacterium sp.]